MLSTPGGGDTQPECPVGMPREGKGALTTLAFFSAFVCLTQRSCVRGRTVEMALESDSLLLPHVAPWSFRPVGVGRGG